MATPDVLYGSLRADPEFMAASNADKEKYLKSVLPTVAPDFAKADPAAQAEYIKSVVLPGINEASGGQVSPKTENPAIELSANAIKSFLPGGALDSVIPVLGLAQGAKQNFNDSAANALTFGGYDAFQGLRDRRRSRFEQRRQQFSSILKPYEEQKGIEAGTLTDLSYGNPLIGGLGEASGMALPFAGLESLASKGLYQGARAAFRTGNPLLQGGVKALYTPLGDPRLLARMGASSLSFGAYDGARKLVEGLPQAGFNVGKNLGNFSQGFGTGAVLGAAGVPAVEGLGAILKAGVRVFKPNPAQIGLGAKTISEPLAKRAEASLRELEDFANAYRNGQAIGRDQDIVDAAELIQELRAHAMGGGTKPLGQVVGKARNVTKRIRVQNNRLYVQDLVDRISSIDAAESQGIISLKGTARKSVDEIKKAIETGKVSDSKIPAIDAMAKKLDAIAQEADKQAPKVVVGDTVNAPANPELPESSPTVAGASSSPDSLQARIEKTRENFLKVKALKEDPRLAEAEALKESVKGQRSPEAKAIRDQADVLRAQVKKEADVLKEELKQLDPDDNIRAVIRAEQATGESGLQSPVDELALTYEDIEADLPTALKAKAQKLAQAAKEDKKVSLEYIAEEAGRSNEAVTITKSGTVKSKTTEFTPTSFGKVTKIIDKETGDVLAKGTKATQEALDNGLAEEKEFILVNGYNQRGHEVKYYLDESTAGSRIAKVNRIIDKPGFRGATPNVYHGQRGFNPMDVLNRGPRSEEGLLKTSEAMSSAEAFKNFVNGEAFKSLPPKAKQIVNKLKKSGRFNDRDLIQLKDLLKEDFEKLQKICAIFGLN